MKVKHIVVTSIIIIIIIAIISILKMGVITSAHGEWLILNSTESRIVKEQLKTLETKAAFEGIKMSHAHRLFIIDCFSLKRLYFAQPVAYEGRDYGVVYRANMKPYKISKRFYDVMGEICIDHDMSLVAD